MSPSDTQVSWAAHKFKKAKALCGASSGASRSVFGVTNPSGVTQKVGSFSAQSSAQVETLVTPQAVTPKSCELKLGQNKGVVSPKQDKRRNPLTVRLTDQERVLVQTRARQAGVTINAYVRASTLGSAYQGPGDPELLGVLRRTLVELTRHGNNLNQIAKHLNAGIETAAQGETSVDAIRPTYLQTLSRVRSALARDRHP